MDIPPTSAPHSKIVLSISFPSHVSMRISLIAAVDLNNAIGLHGDQLVYISQDLKHFKETTMGCPVIMGSRTNRALPKRRLPGRRNIVLTRSAVFAASVSEVEGVEVVRSVDEAIAKVEGESHVFVIGGEQIYRAFMPVADELVLTIIETRFPEADAYFPSFDGWRVVSSSETFTDPKSGLLFRYVTLARG